MQLRPRARNSAKLFSLLSIGLIPALIPAECYEVIFYLFWRLKLIIFQEPNMKPEFLQKLGIKDILFSDSWIIWTSSSSGLIIHILSTLIHLIFFTPPLVRLSNAHKCHFLFLLDMLKSSSSLLNNSSPSLIAPKSSISWSAFFLLLHSLHSWSILSFSLLHMLDLSNAHKCHFIFLLYMFENSSSLLNTSSPSLIAPKFSSFSALSSLILNVFKVFFYW